MGRRMMIYLDDDTYKTLETVPRWFRSRFIAAAVRRFYKEREKELREYNEMPRKFFKLLET